jgi:hypothetical protein
LNFDEVHMPRLLSVNVGLPRDVTWNGKTVRTAAWKSPVVGRRIVRKRDVDGDAQGDLAGHGGEQRAVFVYPMDSYHYWERSLGRNEFVFGQSASDAMLSRSCPKNFARTGEAYGKSPASGCFATIAGIAANSPSISRRPTTLAICCRSYRDQEKGVPPRPSSTM